MYNKFSLITLLPHKHRLINFLIIITFIIAIILSYKIKTYDSYLVSGLNKCDNDLCEIQITVPYNKIDIFALTNNIEYLNKQYRVLNIVYNDPYLDSGIPYQDIIISTDLKTEEKIINFKVLYNKQRIIRKIEKLLKGSD